MIISKSITAVVAIASATVVLAGCGSTDSTSSGSGSSSTAASTTASTTSSSAKVGGPPAACTKDQISKVVEATGAKVNSFKCADGWAVVQASTNDAESFDEVLVLEAEGQFWISPDRAKVCAKPSPIPASLYNDACSTS